MTPTTVLCTQLLAALRGGTQAPDPQAAPGLADALLERLAHALMLEGPAGGPRTRELQAVARALRDGLPVGGREPGPLEEAEALARALVRLLDLAGDLHVVAELAAQLRFDAPRAEVLRRLCARGESAVDELLSPGEDPRGLEVQLLKLSVDGLVHSALRKGNVWRYDPTPAGRVALELMDGGAS